MINKQKLSNHNDFLKLKTHKKTGLKKKTNNILKKNLNSFNYKKANYFESISKTNQNKELIKLKIKSENFLKSNIYKYLKIEKNKELFNLTSKIKLLNLFSKAFKKFIDILVSDIKLNGLNSKFWFKLQNLELKNYIQNNLILINKNHKKINYNDNKEQEQIKEIKITKLLYKKKKTKKILNNNLLTISLPFILNRFKNIKNKFKNEKNNLYSIEKKGNFIGNIKVGFVDEKINKGKNAILKFFFKYNKKSPKNLVSKNSFLTNYKFQDNIKNYINSNLTFNSKIGKYLNTNNNYSFNRVNQLNNLIRNNISEFLYGSFFSMFCIISKPVFIKRQDKLIIQLFYLLLKKKKISKNNKRIIKSNFILENKNKLNIICNILKRFFHKTIELELIKLYYPYYNSNILVNFLGIFINKIRLRKIVNTFIVKSIKDINTKNLSTNNSLIPSAISGIKIKVAGRLLTQRIIPRKTAKIISRGALNRTKAMFVETARFTNKNKRGAFSITISIGHRLNSISINPLHKN